MARKSTGTVPPQITLKEAIEIAKAIYERGGGTMSLDDVATLINSTVKSSAFVMKMAAMRAFGLVITDGKSAQLGNLGRAIVAPTSRGEQQSAIIAAFYSIGVYEALHAKYAGGFLPEDTFLANTLVKEFSSPSEYREKWIKSFKESGRAAGLLRDEGGKMRVLQTPSPIGGYISEPYQSSEGRNDPIREERDYRSQNDARPISQSGPGTFPVVLDDTRSVLVPLDFNRDDLEYLQGVLELYVKRRESKGVQS